ncbi:MAG: hypothetical protein KDM63_14285, partial [Verrucomicrobiae bacterium]|nr:hypothetical protein [Verrucomicrobiae bacterium]
MKPPPKPRESLPHFRHVKHPRLDSSLEKGTSLGRDAWLRLRKNHLAVASMILLAAMFLLCFVVANFCQDP